jgi:uncharacterized protein (TIGR03435 family)
VRHVEGIPIGGHAPAVATKPAATTRQRVRIAVAALLCCAAALAGHTAVLACTAFCAAGTGQVLVGNNEDWNNPRTKIWFVPATAGSYGRVYVGFDDMWPQGGMNERGLWFDGFAAPPVKPDASADLPRVPGNIVDTAMAECSTVEDVVRLFSRYNRAFLTEAILMFADASGDAVSIEAEAMVRKTRRHFVQTNFHQSRPQRGPRDGRFATASAMLERAGEDVSVDLFRRILAATHQKGGAPTLYSNIYDLRSRTMHLYYFHDFERVVTFHLDDELKKGARVLDIPALFPRNAAADAYAARRKDADPSSGRVVAIALVAVPGTLIAIAVIGWIRGGRRARLGLSALAGTLAMLVLLVALTLRMHRQASADWTEFSIGPASGTSVSIGSSTMRASGITLEAAVATAYGVPAVRVIAPPWLAHTRYSIKAVVDVDAPDSFRSLLRHELQNRLRLETHVDVRPFEVFVLGATDAPRLERARGGGPSTWIHEWDAQLQNASMEGLASALQGILGKPVIDETGITGTYDLEFGWTADRASSVTAVLHDRFGLRLTPATRDMDALIVDGIRRDAALVLLAQIGRATSGAPSHLRQRIADFLTIH